MREFIMDDVGATSRLYKEIAVKASSIYVAVLSIYLVFIENGVDILQGINNFIKQNIENDMASILLQIVVSFISTGLIYSVIYSIVYIVYCYKWKQEHRALWIKGTWLHIHDKGNVRIGVVRIKQNFFSIKVKGYNFDPTDIYAADRVMETSWNYALGKIVDDADNDYVIGYYNANRGIKTKSGIHNLRILSGREGQDPMTMTGTFHDLLETGAEVQKVEDSVGNIHMFKLTKEQSFFDELNCRDDQELCYRLADIIKNKRDVYREETYLKKFEEIISKHPHLSEKFKSK